MTVFGNEDPRFAYRVHSVKPSLFSYPGLYIGFAGYYNPFTGEAQVNMLDPTVRAALYDLS